MRARPSSPPSIPGAEYRDFLGSGGFADVYLFDQFIPQRPVAVKVMRRGASDALKRAFRAEANLMARISSHPSILSVFGAGETADERAYIMMEYCPGPNLGKRVRGNPMPVADALQIGIQMAGAAETIHRAGIVHRDIKPSNILFTQFGHPVLTDFGIAHQLNADGEAEIPKGQAEGFSVPWAPPEQATGEGAITAASDIYSLAATIYTMLAGRAPFELADGDNSEIAVINRVLRAPVPPIGRRDVPEQLERVLAAAMSKNPQMRYPSALDFAHALQNVQAELHQQLTLIDVLVDRDAPVLPIDDDDATRQAVRRIDALPETARSLQFPTSNSPALPNERIISVVPPARKAAPGPEFVAPAHTSFGDDDVAETRAKLVAPAAQEAEPTAVVGNEEAPKAKTGSIILILIAAIVAIAIGIAMYFAFKGDSTPSSTVTTTETHKAGDGPIADFVEPVRNLEGKVRGEEVDFTWNYPEVDGVVFLVRPIGQEDSSTRNTTDKKITVDLIKPQTCVEVLVRTENGRTSDPIQRCVATY